MTMGIWNLLATSKLNYCKIISIVNLLTSSLTRKGDIVLGMNCGPEIGVAATKSFTAQLILLYKIVQKLSDSITIDFEKFSESILIVLVYSQPKLSTTRYT